MHIFIIMFKITISKKRIFLLRGFKDGLFISQIYGFYDECMTKYGNNKAYNYFIDIFNYFPLAAKIEKKIFCEHGGLTPEIKAVDDINKLDRIQEINFNEIISCLLWDEPVEDNGNDGKGWNQPEKGPGYYF